ncbi:MAG: DUF1015 domain-containing protein [bacterium]|nr:DUF1015 domain-containing protein [bacterium]
MLEVKPFKGIVYNQEKISDLTQVVAPPYDVISKKDQGRYHNNHPFNIIHIDKGIDLHNDNNINNKYTRATTYLKKWLKEKYLTQDRKPYFYIYQKVYTIDNIQKEVTGFIGLMKLEEFSSQKILPHERTHSKPIKDRLSLLSNCKAHISQIFSLYQDQDIPDLINNFIENKAPFIDIIFEDQIRHKVWRINNEETIRKIQEGMKNKKIFIADGHHRYQTALNYKKQLENEGIEINDNDPRNYIMSYFTNILNKGLTILPTHRLIFNFNGMEFNSIRNTIKKYFHIESCPHLPSLSHKLKENEGSNHIFGLFAENEFYLLTLKNLNLIDRLSPKEQPPQLNHLAVSVLQHTLIHNVLGIKEEEEMEQKISYARSKEEAVNLVKEGKYKLALFVTPTKIEEVEKIAYLGVLMPQKSTYFYPKLLTGLVMYKLD